jgi:hypothetical protein
MVMTAVHARLHASLRREFGLIAKCITIMDGHYSWDESGQFNRQQDFDGKTVGIIPVGGPGARRRRTASSAAGGDATGAGQELYNA